MIKSRNILVFILIVFTVALMGCSSKSSPEKKPDTTTTQKSKAPAELKIISTDLDTLISELDKKFKMKKMSPMQQNIKLIPQTQSGQSQGGQSQGGQSQTGQSQTGQSQTGQSQSQEKDWQKEFSSLKSIHTSWNTLMPEAVGAGMTVSSKDQFGKALDQLTQDISNQKLEESFSAALMLYKNFADVSALFTTQVPAEFYQVKYEIMAAIFESSRKNWTAADEHVPKFKEHWLYLNAQVKDTDPKILSKTEFAILDLQNAIQSKQMDLVIIKGEIAMNNLKSLEDKISSNTSSQAKPSS